MSSEDQKKGLAASAGWGVAGAAAAALLTFVLLGVVEYQADTGPILRQFFLAVGVQFMSVGAAAFMSARRATTAPFRVGMRAGVIATSLLTLIALAFAMNDGVSAAWGFSMLYVVVGMGVAALAAACGSGLNKAPRDRDVGIR